MIFLLHLPLLSQIPGFLCDRKNTVRLVSPQQEMKVWTKAGPLKTALLAQICSFTVCLLSWLPRRPLRDLWTLRMRGIWWICDRCGLGNCDVVAQVRVRGLWTAYCQEHLSSMHCKPCPLVPKQGLMQGLKAAPCSSKVPGSSLGHGRSPRAPVSPGQLGRTNLLLTPWVVAGWVSPGTQEARLSLML